MYGTSDDDSCLGRMMDGVFENPDDICCTCTKRQGILASLCCVFTSFMILVFVVLIWLATRPTAAYVFQPVQPTHVAG